MILSNDNSIQKLLNVILSLLVPFAGSKDEYLFYVTFRQAQCDSEFVILFVGSKDDGIIFNHTLTGLL